MISAQVYGRVLSYPGRRVFAHNDDTSLFIWWFGNAADAMASRLGFGSGHTGLLYTTLMNAPEGVNGAWNTSVLGLALPMVPVTWIAGPVVSYNLAIMGAPVLSALAAALFLRRFCSRAAAFAGGGIYGFSTYAIAQSGGHLNLSFVVFPPILALLLSLAIARPRDGSVLGPRRKLIGIGLGLGVAVGWQLYISSELLAGSSLAALCLLIAVGLVHRRGFPGILARVGSVGAVALGPALVIGAPLFLTMATAPGAPSTTIRPHGVWINDVLDLVVPAAQTLARYPAPELARTMALDPAEIGMYVGPVLLVTVVASAIAFRARPEVRIAAVAGALVWLLSLGAPLRIGGRSFEAPMPWDVIEIVPVLNNVLPMRLAVHVWLAIALLFAVLIDWILTGAGRRWPRRRPLAICAVLVSLAMMAPASVAPYELRIPEFYRGAVEDYVQPGSLVSTYPRPKAMAVPRADEAMVWQSVSGMRYRDTGGYFIGSAPGRPVIFNAAPDALDELLASSGGQLPRTDSAAAKRVAADLRAQGIDALLISDNPQFQDAPPDRIAQFAAGALDTEYRLVEGVYIVPVSDTEILERGAAGS